jgi:hypothetical protein
MESRQIMDVSPYATHADLSALRREIQLDVRGEMRDFMMEVRASLREMEANTATSKQWAMNLLFSVGNLGVAGWYVIWSVIHGG